MDPDSAAGDADSLQGGLSVPAAPLEQLLVDAVTQQQGWLRVYGRPNPNPPGAAAAPGASWRLTSSSWTEFVVSASSAREAATNTSLGNFLGARWVRGLVGSWVGVGAWGKCLKLLSSVNR